MSDFELLDNLLVDASDPEEQLTEDLSDIYESLDEMIEESMRETLMDIVLLSDIPDVETMTKQVNAVRDVKFTEEEILEFMEEIIAPKIIEFLKLSDEKVQSISRMWSESLNEQTIADMERLVTHYKELLAKNKAGFKALKSAGRRTAIKRVGFRIAPLVISAAVIAAGLILLKKSDKECSKYDDPRTLNKFYACKKSATKKAISKLKSGKSECKNSRNPEKCEAKIDKEISRLIKKQEKFDEYMKGKPKKTI